MLENLLNFPKLIWNTSEPESEIWGQISQDHNGQFPALEEIIAGLRNDPTSIERWIQYSQDKRVTPSWYILKIADKYKVGYLAQDQTCYEGLYDNAYFACALFIKLEMEARLVK